jgi:Mitochondrial carrier protein
LIHLHVHQNSPLTIQHQQKFDDTSQKIKRAGEVFFVVFVIVVDSQQTHTSPGFLQVVEEDIQAKIYKLPFQTPHRKTPPQRTNSIFVNMSSSSDNKSSPATNSNSPTATMGMTATPTLLQSTVLGGTAAMVAVNFTHPIELVKSRVQVSENGVLQTCSSTMRNEGVAAFWKGLPWAYCREGSYTAIRLGGG